MYYICKRYCYPKAEDPGSSGKVKKIIYGPGAANVEIVMPQTDKYHETTYETIPNFDSQFSEFSEAFAGQKTLKAWQKEHPDGVPMKIASTEEDQSEKLSIKEENATSQHQIFETSNQKEQKIESSRSKNSNKITPVQLPFKQVIMIQLFLKMNPKDESKGSRKSKRSQMSKKQQDQLDAMNFVPSEHGQIPADLADMLEIERVESQLKNPTGNQEEWPTATKKSAEKTNSARPIENDNSLLQGKGKPTDAHASVDDGFNKKEDLLI